MRLCSAARAILAAAYAATAHGSSWPILLQNYFLRQNEQY
jgi:hypothetical protein